MKRKILIFLMLFWAVSTKAQIELVEVNYCHDKNKQLNSIHWLSYDLKFECGFFKYFYTTDSSIFYNVRDRIIRISIPNDTLVIELKADGVKLTSLKKDSIVFLSISNEVIICDNEDQEELIKLNKIGNLGILPIIKEKCKLKGLQLPLINSKSLSIFFFRGVGNKRLYWDIIISGLKENYKDYNQIKLFSSDFDGQPSSLNFCYKNGGSADYKNIDPGIEVVFTENKSNRSLWKIRRVVETKHSDYMAYSDLIEYNRKGKVKSSKIALEECVYK